MAGFIECDAPIVAVDDALSMISTCAVRGTNRLLIDAQWLPSAFFELRTRFAGEFLQKLQNYRLRVALVLDPDADHGSRFGEFVAEHRTGSDIRVFHEVEDARAWLSRDQPR